MYDEKLVLDNINLIYLVLKRLKLYHEQEEYFDIGMIGLVRGATTFNKELGYSPTTYLYKCIYNEILKEINKKKLETTSLDKLVDEVHTLKDIIPDKKTLESDYFLGVDNIIINEALKELTEKEQTVIKFTFGLNGIQMTQRELARILGVTPTSIGRTKKRALRKLKIKLEGKI